MPDLFYTTVERVYDLEPDIGSISTLTSAQIVTAFAQPAEALINAVIAQLYNVPITPAPMMLKALADDITVYRILSRRVFTAQQLKNSTWPDRFKEALDTLNDIGGGDTPLVTDSGTVILTGGEAPAMVSNTMGYRPTFDEQISEDWRIDEVKLNDLRRWCR